VLVCLAAERDLIRRLQHVGSPPVSPELTEAASQDGAGQTEEAGANLQPMQRWVAYGAGGAVGALIAAALILALLQLN
jgi:hypothetical protein